MMVRHGLILWQALFRRHHELRFPLELPDRHRPVPDIGPRHSSISYAANDPANYHFLSVPATP
jgi:hypothetical protein